MSESIGRGDLVVCIVGDDEIPEGSIWRCVDVFENTTGCVWCKNGCAHIELQGVPRQTEDGFHSSCTFRPIRRISDTFRKALMEPVPGLKVDA